MFGETSPKKIGPDEVGEVGKKKQDVLYFQNALMPHVHEKIDFTADALIVHENKVLLRMHDKYNVWLTVGGHIELDEDPYQALLREVQEECGLEVELVGRTFLNKFKSGSTNLPTPHFMNRHPINEIHEHINFIYVCRAKTLDIKPRAGEKPVEFKWFTAEELKDPKYGVLDSVQYYASEALKIAASDN